MAEFHEIGSSQFTEVTPTGKEQIQISATQKTTLQKIADLFKGQADPNSLAIKDFNDSTPFSDGTQNTKVKFFVANAATVLNGPSNTGITSGSYYGIAIATGLMPNMGRVEYLLWVQGKKTLFRGYKVYISGNVSNGSGWEEVSGSGSLSDLKISGWTDITKYSDVKDPYIQNGDTLVDALRKLQWMTGNNTVKTFGNSSGVGMMFWDGDVQNDLFTAFYFEIETHSLTILFEGTFSDLGAQATNDQIINYIINEGASIYLSENYQSPIGYVNTAAVSISLGGGSSIWYTGTSNPTVTLNTSYSGKSCTSCIIVPYNRTPTFTKQVTSDVIHMHQNAAEVAPTSGYKVYTVFCQIVSGVRHFFVNVAPYN